MTHTGSSFENIYTSQIVNRPTYLLVECVLPGCWTVFIERDVGEKMWWWTALEAAAADDYDEDRSDISSQRALCRSVPFTDRCSQRSYSDIWLTAIYKMTIISVDWDIKSCSLAVWRRFPYIRSTDDRFCLSVYSVCLSGCWVSAKCDSKVQLVLLPLPTVVQQVM